MRVGRLAVYSTFRADGTRFFVVPDDGSEPIELRVNRATVSCKAGEAAIAAIRCYVTAIEIEDPIENLKVSAVATKPGTVVVYPHVTINDGALGDVSSFLWRFRAGSFGRIVLSRLKFERAA